MWSNRSVTRLTPRKQRAKIRPWRRVAEQLGHVSKVLNCEGKFTTAKELTHLWRARLEFKHSGEVETVPVLRVELNGSVWICER